MAANYTLRVNGRFQAVRVDDPRPPLLGPSCAIAEYRDERLSVLSASQATHMLKKQLTNTFSITPDNVDPIQYRLKHLKDARGAECIERCAALAQWTPRSFGKAGARDIVQTVSRTLIEELQFGRSRVTGVDWESYPLRFPDVPQIAIDLIDRPDGGAVGAGAPAAAVVPSAIPNAIYDATGARLRSVPFTPEKVLRAL